MGSYITFYAGAVLRIKKEQLIKTVVVPKIIPQCCCNHLCKGNFCSICGKPLIKGTVEEKIILDAHDLIEDFDDEEYDDEYTVYFPEYLSSNEYMLGISNSDNACSVMNISPDHYNMELIIDDSFKYKTYVNEFNKIYSGFLKFLKSRNIEYDVKFMILTYYS